jgi:hypothetical protein
MVELGEEMSTRTYGVVRLTSTSETMALPPGQ